MNRFTLSIAGLTLLFFCLGAQIPEAHQRYFDEDGRLRWVPPPEPVIERLPDGRVRISDIVLSPRERSALIPVSINAQPGEELEYALVHVNGKLHESLLRTETHPTYLHIAMLLLGFEELPPSDNDPDDLPPARIDQQWLERTVLPRGPSVELELVAEGADGEPTAFPFEAFITDLSRDEPVSRGRWVYNGSTTHQGIFLAEVEGSYISLITDPTALINYTGPQRVNDLNWVAREHPQAFPAQSTQLFLRITLIDGHTSP